MGDLPLGLGSTGAAVRDLQDRLAGLGYAIDRSEVDRFGSSTEQAIRAFQLQRHLTEDGVCGRQTWSALVEAGFRLGDRYLYLRAPYLRGDDVADLQRQLSSLGFDPGRIDGILGPDTEQALKDFQRNLGITVDGVCGRDVVQSLERIERRAVGGDISAARERMSIPIRATGLTGRKVAVGDLGGSDALTHAICRELADLGATAIQLVSPDEGSVAQQANEIGADVCVALRLCESSFSGVDFFTSPSWASPGGSSLATILIRLLGESGLPVENDPRGMATSLLRETRMPTVLCRLGPATAIVPATATLANTVGAALLEWSKPSG